MRVVFIFFLSSLLSHILPGYQINRILLGKVNNMRDKERVAFNETNTFWYFSWYFGFYIFALFSLASFTF